MEKKRMDYIPMWGRYLPMFRNAGLTDVQLGHLMRAMMEYHFEGKEPLDLEDKLEVFWMFIREDLDRAKLKYDQAVENGRKGGRPRKNQEKPKESPSNRKKGRTTTKTTSTTTSTSTTETTSSHAPGGEALSLDQKAYGEFGWVQLEDEAYQKLASTMGVEELQRCIAYIDRSAQSTGNRNEWQDWALILQRCYEGRWHDAAHRPDPIPKGASGYLGEAELEAIQRVLQEDSPNTENPFHPVKS